MRLSESESEFRAFLASRGKRPETLLPEDLLTLGFEFFEKVRASDVQPMTENDMGDALLLEWFTRQAIPGHYDTRFCFGLTRQFISEVGEDDDAMFQLICVLEYPPSSELQALGTVTRWCKTLAELPDLRQFALSHAAYEAVRGKKPSLVQFYFSGV